MKRSRTGQRFVLLCALALLCATACGGGGGGGSSGGDGGGGGDLEATYTGDASGGGGGDVSMTPGAAADADFDVEIKVDGPLDNFFGIALRVQVPADIRLLGRTSTGSVLLGAPGGTIFDASQAQVGEEVLVTATRVQPAPGFDEGVDLPAGKSHVMTLRFRAEEATAGDMPPTDTELRTCDLGTTTCSALGGLTFTGGSIVAN
jgi:hypothetical protein